MFQFVQERTELMRVLTPHYKNKVERYSELISTNDIHKINEDGHTELMCAINDYVIKQRFPNTHNIDELDVNALFDNIMEQSPPQEYWNYSPEDNYSLIHFAVDAGLHYIVESLMNIPEVVVSTVNCNSLTPLLMCCGRIDYLIKTPKTYVKQIERQKAILTLLLKSGKQLNVDEKDSDGIDARTYFTRFARKLRMKKSDFP